MSADYGKKLSFYSSSFLRFNFFPTRYTLETQLIFGCRLWPRHGFPNGNVLSTLGMATKRTWGHRTLQGVHAKFKSRHRLRLLSTNLLFTDLPYIFFCHVCMYSGIWNVGSLAADGLMVRNIKCGLMPQSSCSKVIARRKFMKKPRVGCWIVLQFHHELAYCNSMMSKLQRLLWCKLCFCFSFPLSYSRRVKGRQIGTRFMSWPSKLSFKNRSQSWVKNRYCPPCSTAPPFWPPKWT